MFGKNVVRQGRVGGSEMAASPDEFASRSSTAHPSEPWARARGGGVGVREAPSLSRPIGSGLLDFNRPLCTCGALLAFIASHQVVSSSFSEPASSRTSSSPASAREPSGFEIYLHKTNTHILMDAK
eukprot:INCI1489.2.p2 GENE.INCI1489.2~~INCI1489.2.p2  ORF type:complete len:126 (+),score=10.30 INCI1489.2:122-499(+)